MLYTANTQPARRGRAGFVFTFYLVKFENSKLDEVRGAGGK